MVADREQFDTKIWVEDNQGRVISRKDLVPSGSHMMVMREVSPNLGLEAWVLRLRFQPRGDDIRVCSCHPDSTHEGKWLVHSSMGRVYSAEASPRGSKLFQRLTTELWDCVILFENTRVHSILRNLLIIEYIGDSIRGVPTAQRVGTVTLHCRNVRQTNRLKPDEPDALERVVREKKRIRLV